ncbi:MAG: lipo-like protein [Alphaproteobacteria bacterium]|nr:lipo-like protein [Alphaproteobacteria bacterium]
MAGNALTWIGQRLARYINGPICDYEPFAVTPHGILEATLQPGDVLLVEGNRRVSVAIKYLTQSTWSHAALYVGDALGPKAGGGEPDTLVEADIVEGVRVLPLSEYRNFNTRICHPIGLSDEDREAVIRFAVERIGLKYDLKNIFDLLRYLLPTPPVPTRWRRRMLRLGSGDPTQAICSGLIAQAFQSVRYPILPHVTVGQDPEAAPGIQARREILQIRHHSLFAPRDFDVSPYFRVVKPTLEMGFYYQQLRWDDTPLAPEPAGPGECRNPELAAREAT